MKRAWWMLLCCFTGPAWAGDVDVGRRAFASNCSGCHVARTVKGGKKEPTPWNLALWANGRTGADLRTWVTNPWALKPKTACKPRGVQLAQLDSLLSFLRSADEVPIPREARRAQELKAAMKARAAKQQKSRSSSPRPEEHLR